MYGRVVESLRSQAWKVHREVMLPHRYHDKKLEEARTSLVRWRGFIPPLFSEKDTGYAM